MVIEIMIEETTGLAVEETIGVIIVFKSVEIVHNSAPE